MKYLLIALLMINFAFCKEVVVVADKFSASEITKKATFVQNVKVSKDKDLLKADKLIISFDKKRKPIKYEANGHASIRVFIKNKEYFGSGKSLIYEPKIDEYSIKGDAILIDKTTKKEVRGEIIRVNQKSGKYEVLGKKNQPVKFIFQIDDKDVGKKLNDKED